MNANCLRLSALLLSSAFCAPAWAVALVPQSKIDAVTVYLQGADVVRSTAVDLPAGEHQVILRDLPANIDPQSIRVEGFGTDGRSFAIASVDSRNLFIGSADLDQQRRVLEKQIQVLQDERLALDTAIADATHQRTFLISLADKQLTPQTTTETLKGIDVTQLGGLIDLVGQRLAGLAKMIQQAQLKQREIDEKVSDLSNQLVQLAPGNTHRTEVVVNVEADAAVAGQLKVSYRVNEATWTPYYDAKLAIGGKGKASALELIRRAAVTQATSESWNDVALTLSTARPTGSTAAPDIQEEEIHALLERQRAMKSLGALNEAPASAPRPDELAMDQAQHGAGLDLGGKRKDDDILAMQKQAVTQMAGFQANYLIATRVSIDNTGQSKKVRISGTSHDAALEAVTVPRLDPNAYLTAHFTLKGEGPQMPGTVNLYRDGVYVGQGYLPLLNPSETAKLGFGVDDLVKVERKEVKRLSGEEGLIMSSSVELRAWDIAIRNLHDIAMPVTVMDRTPFASLKDIEIEDVPGMTEPTERNVEKKRGVMAWAFTLEPKAEKVLKTGYKITWPEGMQVGLVD
jgi:uncharacterized protein (TIGR02231 family)